MLINPKDLTWSGPLGKGSYGLVLRAVWKKETLSPLDVAVKTVNEKNVNKIRNEVAFDGLSRAVISRCFFMTRLHAVN